MARSERFNVELNATDNASRTIDEVAAKAEGLPDKATVELDATDAASEDIEKVGQATETLDGTEASVDLAAEDEATPVVEAAGEAVEELDGSTATATLDATDEASGTVEDAAAAVEALDDVSGTATLDATDNASTAAADAVVAVEGLDDVDGFATLDALDSVTPSVESAIIEVEGLDDVSGFATLDTTDLATPDIEAVSGELVTLDTESASPDITIAGDDASDVTDVSGALGVLDDESASAEMNVEGASEANADIGGIVDNLDTIKKGLLTGGAAAALTSMFDSAADRAIDVQSLATATGESLDNATAFKESMELAEIPIQRALTMIGRVNDKLLEQPELAGRLGITIEENQTPLQTFIETVDALNNGQLTANERLALATELFGLRGLSIVSNLDTVVGNLSEDMASMPEWQAITEEDVAAAVEYRRTVDDLKDILGEVAQNTLAAFGPGVANFFEDLRGVGAAVSEAFEFGQEGTSRSVFDFMQDLSDEDLVRINDAFREMGGSVESLRKNYFHLNEVAALLELGVPPEAIASAKLTDEALSLLIDTMADTEEAAAAWRTALDNGQVSQAEWNQITRDGVVSLREVEAAVEDTDAALAEGTSTVEERAEAEALAADETARLEAALRSQMGALDEAIEKNEEYAEAISETGDQYLDQRDAVRDAQKAVEDYAEAMQPVEDDTRTQTEVLRDQEEALDAVVKSYERVADGAEEEARAVAEASGVTFDAVDAHDAHNASLLASASTLTGPMRTALLEHIARINGIPTSKITEIEADADPNDIAQVETLLNTVSRTRAALVSARDDAAARQNVENLLNNLARFRTATIAVRQVGNLVGFQHGSPFTPDTDVLVGEDGPELVRLPTGSKVFRNDQTEEMLHNGGGGGGTVINNNTIHMPAGTPSTTIRNLRRYERRNGKLNGVVT